MADNMIYNPAKLSRPVVFSGLPHVGPCSPTDIDAPDVSFCIEVGDMKRYLIGDFKEHGKLFKHRGDGQRILLERHVHAFMHMGYTAFAFLAWHPEDVMEIDAASSLVVLQYGGYPPPSFITWQEVNPPEKLIDKYCKFFKVERSGVYADSFDL